MLAPAAIVLDAIAQRTDTSMNKSSAVPFVISATDERTVDPFAIDARSDELMSVPHVNPWPAPATHASLFAITLHPFLRFRR